MIIKNNCKNCNQELTTYPSRIALGRGIYCSRACSNKFTLIQKGQHLSKPTEIRKGTIPQNFKGYRLTRSRKTSKYYNEIYYPSHPFATKSGYIREHRLIMELEIDRLLDRNEIVHHIDGNTLNNSPANLEVMLKVEHDRINTPLNIHKRWQKGVPTV